MLKVNIEPSGSDPDNLIGMGTFMSVETLFGSATGGLLGGMGGVNPFIDNSVIPAQLFLSLPNTVILRYLASTSENA